MDVYRFRIVMFLLMLSVGLCGFKKPLRHNKPFTSKGNPATIKVQSKPLDLSLPQPGQFFGEMPQKLAEASQSDESLFTNGKNKSTALELEGQLIMTQEQEREKRRSADGAGIMINLRH